jgi:ABC-2 type transport system permease protein
VRTFVTGFRLQLWIFRASLSRLSIVVAVPFYVLIFMSITRYAGRGDLDLVAALAPCLAGMWTLTITMAGDLIAMDKRFGVLEPLLASPARLIVILFGRCAAIGILGLVCAAESIALAVLFFGVRPTATHPILFLAGILVTCVAMAGAAGALSVLFVLGRSNEVMRNSFNYPIYVLGGIFVPVVFLPNWLQPVSYAIFLSWSADLLRDSLIAAQVGHPLARLGVIAGLGVLGILVGTVAQALVLRRIRTTGTILW